MSIVGKAFQTPRMHGLSAFQFVVKATELRSWRSHLVQCPGTDIVDKVWTNVLQWGRRVNVELQGLWTERSQDPTLSPAFFQTSSLKTQHGELTSRQPQFSSRSLKCTEGWEDHLGFVPATEALGRPHHSGVV
ncbi:hypothetical protein K443DRAFT_189946 [Laccaria amethystina LaAM-08-1]|uniref:Uncharacterized protein n=1 Tax=Laccaria amethystina LaAM-08-1 TaxID=1095629 RepID=A0A0C9XT18_9AGAR|nr:hypothetical protein K443DRAFT_189946 [Laccaria amethystina LaAM-08-1]